AAPENLDLLSLGDRGQIDIDGRARRDRRPVRVHLGDERPDGGGDADGANGTGGDVDEVPATGWQGVLVRGGHGSILLLRPSRSGAGTPDAPQHGVPQPSILKPAPSAATRHRGKTKAELRSTRLMPSCCEVVQIAHAGKALCRMRATTGPPASKRST